MIKELEEQKAQILNQFINQSDGNKIIELQKKLKDTEKEIADLEEEWFSLQDI